MKERKMKNEIEFNEIATSMVNVFRSEYKGMCLELSKDKTHLQVFNDDGCETFDVYEGQCTSEGGVIGMIPWTDEEWVIVEDAIDAA